MAWCRCPGRASRSGLHTAAGSAACGVDARTCRILQTAELRPGPTAPAAPAALCPPPSTRWPLALQQGQVLWPRGGKRRQHSHHLLEVIIPFVGGQCCQKLAAACRPQGPAGVSQIGAHSRLAPHLCWRDCRRLLRTAFKACWWGEDMAQTALGSRGPEGPERLRNSLLCPGAQNQGDPPSRGLSSSSGPKPLQRLGTFRLWPRDQVGPTPVQVLSGIQLPGRTLGQGQLVVQLPLS